MEIFLVGGAVRDSLLKLPVQERDWVVINSSPEEMIELGYKKIGKQFPVFLDPIKKEEYALARKERKTEVGHKGFEVVSSKDVTLEEDLLRRDLTINAIAQDKNGELIDPYGGVEDIRNKKLRMVSKAFKEDPLRVFRTARFAAKLCSLGFSVEQRTLTEMKKIVSSGEIISLSKERIWKETEKALETKNPEVYFQTLLECKVGGGFSLISNIEDLGQCSESIIEPEDRWAVLSSFGNSNETIYEHFNLPNRYKELSRICNSVYKILPEINKDPKKLLDFLLKEDCFRRPERFLKAIKINQTLEIIKTHYLSIPWSKLINEINSIKINETEVAIIKRKTNLERIKIINKYLENL
tara:strand:+ start:8654 stop:9715 length:1062 start_codon:yes stop_codon:yes gene_type:complete